MSKRRVINLASLRFASPVLRLGTIITLAISIGGCAPRHQEERLAGISVPVPAGMKKVPSSSDAVDFGMEQKGEQAQFHGSIPREEIVRFYMDVLPAADWQPDARIGAEVGGYAFKRGNQVIAIRIHESNSGDSTLIVLAKVGEFSPGKA